METFERPQELPYILPSPKPFPLLLLNNLQWSIYFYQQHSTTLGLHIGTLKIFARSLIWRSRDWRELSIADYKEAIKLTGEVWTHKLCISTDTIELEYSLQPLCNSIQPRKRKREAQTEFKSWFSKINQVLIKNDFVVKMKCTPYLWSSTIFLKQRQSWDKELHAFQYLFDLFGWASV